MYYRDEKFLKKFGTNLKRIRESKNISQLNLANELGTSQSHIWKIETGIVDPSLSRLSAIAKALKVPLKELFDF